MVQLLISHMGQDQKVCVSYVVRNQCAMASLVGIGVMLLVAIINVLKIKIRN